MRFLSPVLKGDLLARINGTIDLRALLDMFGQEIEKLGLFDGYLINLRDAASENLISYKVRFAPEFHFLEETYYLYKVPLVGDTLNVSARSFHKRGIVRVNANNASEVEKQLLTVWKLDEIVAIPFQDDVAGTDQTAIGTFLLLKQKGKIEDRSISILGELASIFYKPICNALEFAALKENRDRYDSAAAENARFLKFIVAINNLTSPDKIYDLFATELFMQLAFDGIYFFLLENDALINQKVIVSNPRYQEVCTELERYFGKTPYELKNTDGGISHAFINNAHLMFPDTQRIIHLPMSEKDRKMTDIMKTARTLLIIPIRYQGKPIGTIMFFSLAEIVPVADADLHLLSDLSSFLGTAIINSKNYALSRQQNIEIARLNQILEDKVEELAEQAAIDSLTGLNNFRVFERELGRRLSEYQRTTDKDGLSIAIIDIDHFKNFNDTYGHGAGNDVLAGVAQEIIKLVRKMDLACRYGGEEFVVIMTKCELDGIKVFAERMRAQIEHATFKTDAGQLSVTVSIGCTTFLSGDTYETLFNRADRALYRAKDNGRNRIEAD